MPAKPLSATKKVVVGEDNSSSDEEKNNNTKSTTSIAKRKPISAIRRPVTSGTANKALPNTTSAATMPTTAISQTPSKDNETPSNKQPVEDVVLSSTEPVAEQTFEPNVIGAGGCEAPRSTQALIEDDAAVEAINNAFLSAPKEPEIQENQDRVGESESTDTKEAKEPAARDYTDTVLRSESIPIASPTKPSDTGAEPLSPSSIPLGIPTSPSSATGGSRLGGRGIRIGTNADRASSTWAAKRKSGAFNATTTSIATPSEESPDTFGDLENTTKEQSGSSPSPTSFQAPGTPQHSTLGSRGSGRPSVTPRLAPAASSIVLNGTNNILDLTCTTSTMSGTSRSQTLQQTQTLAGTPSGGNNSSNNTTTSSSTNLRNNKNPIKIPPAAKYDLETAVSILQNSLQGKEGVSNSSVSSSTTTQSLHKTLNTEITAQDLKDAAAAAKLKASLAANMTKEYFGKIAGGGGINGNRETSSATAEKALLTSSTGSAIPLSNLKLQELFAMPIVKIIPVMSGAPPSQPTNVPTNEGEHTNNSVPNSTGASSSSQPSSYEPPSARFASLHNAAAEMSYMTSRHLYDSCFKKNIAAPLAALTHKSQQHTKAALGSMESCAVESKAMASLILTMPIWF